MHTRTHKTPRSSLYVFAGAFAFAMYVSLSLSLSLCRVHVRDIVQTRNSLGFTKSAFVESLLSFGDTQTTRAKWEEEEEEEEKR